MSDNYATPPPQSTPPQSMPIKHGLSTLFRFTTNHKYRQREMTEMGNEMKGYIVGPMPASLFLNEFFPSKHTLWNSRKVIRPKEGHFSKVVSCTCETEAYDPFITAVKQFTPTFEFVNSSTHIDSSGQSEFSFDIKPNICVYTTTSKRRGPTDVACAELLIEFKWHSSDDPFCHPTTGDDNERTFLCDGKACADTIGQITSYATAQLGSQFRTCIYSVLIVKDYARLIRWDRTGAIVTDPIHYNDEDSLLLEFIRRYHKAPPKVHGVNTTITLPTALKISHARECLGLVESTLFVKMTVPGPGPDREYIVPAPTAKPYTPPGRATRGFVGYDLQRHMKVFIKDTWRVDLPDIEKEGDTYAVMAAAQVKNIAPCSAAGDIGDHTTLTHLFKDEPWACKTKRVLVPHHHYRLVLDLIGKPLTTFSSSLQMLRCVLDALIAHECAFNAGVLHRDISVRNILIVDGGGILIDWDLSKRLPAKLTQINEVGQSNEVRQPTRTGTWQFMSAALVKNKTAPHTFIDDLESTFYVIVWLLVMYSPSSMSPGDRTSFIKSVLDPEQFEGTGGSAKADFLQARTALRELTFADRPTLQPLLIDLATLFSVRYEKEPTKDEQDLLAAFTGLQQHRELLVAWSYSDRSSKLKSHRHIIKLLAGYTEDTNGWPSDCAVEQKLIDPSDQGKKRKTKTGWDLSDRPLKQSRK